MQKRIKIKIKLDLNEFYSEEELKELLYEQFLSELTCNSDDLCFFERNAEENEYGLSFQNQTSWYTDTFTSSSYEEIGKKLKEALEEGYAGEPVYIHTIQVENQIFILKQSLL